MIYLNLGCGYPRPLHAPWLNIDQLHTSLPNPKSPERIGLAKERNYIDCDLSRGIPFDNSSVEGIVASHMVEHLTPREALDFFRECKRVLKIGGVLRISVPDTDLMIGFEKAGIEYSNEYRPEGMTFTEHVLTFGEHKQLPTEGSMFALFFMSGFKDILKVEFGKTRMPGLAELDNRREFSLFMEGTKCD
jgi:predicted SAM-dependent methyltransferase